VRGARPETLDYDGAAESLKDVSLADLAAGNLPDGIGEITSDPEAWQSH
jgi:hypothetical protein